MRADAPKDEEITGEKKEEQCREGRNSRGGDIVGLSYEGENNLDMCDRLLISQKRVKHNESENGRERILYPVDKQ